MHSQIEWYRKWVSKKAAEDDLVPAIAFIHIPLPEMITMWNYHSTLGSQGDWDGVCCSSLNTGLFAAFKEFGEVRAIVSGHDHANDFIGEYQGVLLGYGRKSGYGGYFKTGWSHGSRIARSHLLSHLLSDLIVYTIAVANARKSIFHQHMDKGGEWRSR
jgi:hypothetical protein